MPWTFIVFSSNFTCAITPKHSSKSPNWFIFPRNRPDGIFALESNTDSWENEKIIQSRYNNFSIFVIWMKAFTYFATPITCGPLTVVEKFWYAADTRDFQWLWNLARRSARVISHRSIEPKRKQHPRAFSFLLSFHLL